jgi:hypothetical protein
MSRWQWALIDIALILLVTNAAVHAKQSWMYAVISGQCATTPEPRQCHPPYRAHLPGPSSRF